MVKSKTLENFFEQRHRQWEKRVRVLLHSIGREHGAHSTSTGREAAKSLNQSGSKEDSHLKNKRS